MSQGIPALSGIALPVLVLLQAGELPKVGFIARLQKAGLRVRNKGEMARLRRGTLHGLVEECYRNGEPHYRLTREGQDTLSQYLDVLSSLSRAPVLTVKVQRAEALAVLQRRLERLEGQHTKAMAGWRKEAREALEWMAIDVENDQALDITLTPPTLDTAELELLIEVVNRSESATLDLSVEEYRRIYHGENDEHENAVRS